MRNYKNIIFSCFCFRLIPLILTDVNVGFSEFVPIDMATMLDGKADSPGINKNTNVIDLSCICFRSKDKPEKYEPLTITSIQATFSIPPFPFALRYEGNSSSSLLRLEAVRICDSH